MDFLACIHSILDDRKHASITISHGELEGHLSFIVRYRNPAGPVSSVATEIPSHALKEGFGNDYLVVLIESRLKDEEANEST